MLDQDFRLEREASLGDRAVAIAAFLAIVATGFFGAEPEPVITPVATANTTQSAER